MENWKEILETNGKYSVSDLGRVRNNRTGRILKQFNVNKYLRVYVDNKAYRVNRLVAQYFCNAKGLDINVLEADHVNNNRLDNRACNLQWLTKTENIRKDLCKAVVKVEGNIKYNSLTDAAIDNNTTIDKVCKACNNSYKFNKNNKYMYLDNYNRGMQQIEEEQKEFINFMLCNPSSSATDWVNYKRNKIINKVKDALVEEGIKGEFDISVRADGSVVIEEVNNSLNNKECM